MIGYASHTLTKAEANYSVIQRVFGNCVGHETVRHYLLGRAFQLMTDHASLQWLGEEKMEGLLCCWALAIQEFSFEIVYRKGSTNGNADALSRRRGPDMETGYTALTAVHASFTVEEIRQAQQQDDTIQQLYKALQSEQHHPHRHWKRPPLRRYAQLWPQLVTVDGIIPARAYFRNHCGPCFARNTAPASSEYRP